MNNEYIGLKAIVSYMVSDGKGGSARGKLAIKVALPSYSDVETYEQQGTSTQEVISGNLLITNTEDYRNALFISSFAIDAHTYSPGFIATIPHVGKMQVLHDGTYVFSPDTLSDDTGAKLAFSVSEFNNFAV